MSSLGFPSPADDYIEGKLDLNEHLIKHPAATFFVRVSGESMIKAGIYPGDILIVDRSLEAVDKKIVIAVLDGELTVKRLRIRSGRPSLEPENDRYAPIEIKPDMVTGVSEMQKFAFPLSSILCMIFLRLNKFMIPIKSET